MNEDLHEEENLFKEDSINIDLITDDLYILKNSLIVEGKLTSEISSYLNQIESLLNQFPELANKLYEWRFLENEALHILRTERYTQILRIISLIISNLKKAPKIYFSKKFLFFITEKLYFAMGGKCIYKQETLSSTIPSSLNITAKACDDFTDEKSIFYDKIKPIMIFVKNLISVDRSVVNILYEISFFVLANACICLETAEMFNQIYVGVFFSNHVENESQRNPWIQDGLYEIRRPFFDPEIIFRNKNVFYPKTEQYKIKSGVFKDIYDQCTNIRDFADLSFIISIDLLLYDKILYMSDEIDPLILEAKNPKILKFYRRYLEAGGIPEKGYLNSIIKATDNPDTSKDATIILYYMIEFIETGKLFTENRVRSIIQNLEYNCNYECEIKDKFIVTKENKKTEEKKSILQQGSFDSEMYTNEIFGETGNEGLFFTPKEAPKQISSKSILEDFSEFDVELVESKKQNTIENCEKYRITKVISHIYTLLDRKLFFKPSYLILFRTLIGHLPSEAQFINTFFRDFVDFLSINKMNISKVFMTVNESVKRRKMREIHLKDDLLFKSENEMLFKSNDEKEDDLLFDPDNEMPFKSDNEIPFKSDNKMLFKSDNEMPFKTEDENKSNTRSNSNGLKIKKGIIESDEE